jgi:excisionase family DNA binding protein
MTAVEVQPLSVPSLLTKAETAEALRISPATLDRMIRRGQVRVVRVGERGVRVTVAELERLLVPAEPKEMTL